MEEKEFFVFWDDGKVEEMKGETIAKAFSNAGYGGGAISAVDFYLESREAVNDYVFSKEDRRWNRINN